MILGLDHGQCSTETFILARFVGSFPLYRKILELLRQRIFSFKTTIMISFHMHRENEVYGTQCEAFHGSFTQTVNYETQLRNALHNVSMEMERKAGFKHWRFLFEALSKNYHYNLGINVMDPFEFKAEWG